MFGEEDLLPLSGLQHLAFCERQCALIHVDGCWAENRLTAKGRILHRKVHDGSDGLEADRLVLRGVRLRSLHLGLHGVADVVEFHPDEEGITLNDRPGTWIPFPVEYKNGRPKKGDEDRVQLCAQAMCLEDVLEIPISVGAIFYGKTRRRIEVEFDQHIRQRTSSLASRFHEMVDQGNLPEPTVRPACKSCSLQDACMPKVVGRASTYVQQMIMASSSGDG